MHWDEKNISYKIIGEMDEKTKTAFFKLSNATKIENEDL